MSAIVDEYQERLDRLGAVADDLDRRSRRLSGLRLLVFGFAALAFALVLFGPPAWRSWASGLGTAVFGLFVVLVVWHSRVEKRRQRSLARVEVQERAIARIERRWKDLPDSTWNPTLTETEAFVARDLGLFGHASLFRLIDTTVTPVGRRRLARALIDGFEPLPADGDSDSPSEYRGRSEWLETAEERRQAVQELVPRLHWRQELEVEGHLAEVADQEPRPLLDWAEAQPVDAWPERLAALSWFLPVVFIAILTAAILGQLPWSLVFASAGLNALLTMGVVRRHEASLSVVEGRYKELAAYSGLAKQVEIESFESSALERSKAALIGREERASKAMKGLSGIAESSMTRHSSYHVILQALTLWDLHILRRLERWRRRNGAQARAWLEAIGDFEVIASAASLAHDHPEWVWPEWIEDKDSGVLEDSSNRETRVSSLTAEKLCHPLLALDVARGNDVEVGPPGSFLLVTGSNMAGKSTLLRAIGLATLLARAGAVVPANRLRLPPLEPLTSILIEDSLESGVSFFYAELKRLQAIVEAARRRREGEPRLLVLLDEILRGTNTEERRIAVGRVLLALADLGAIGAVSTHDLELVAEPRLAAMLVPVHFREILERQQVDGKETVRMNFDYRLRSGLATTTNALVLLESLGIGLEEGS